MVVIVNLINSSRSVAVAEVRSIVPTHILQAVVVQVVEMQPIFKLPQLSEWLAKAIMGRRLVVNIILVVVEAQVAQAQPTLQPEGLVSKTTFSDLTTIGLVEAVALGTLV
jgi:hypothetical protein